MVITHGKLIAGTDREPAKLLQARQHYARYGGEPMTHEKSHSKCKHLCLIHLCRPEAIDGTNNIIPEVSTFQRHRE